MGKRTGRIAVPGSLITAAALCFATTTAQGATLTVSSSTGSASQQATFTVTLGGGNSNVAGTLNDITFDSANVPPAVGATGTGTCSTTTAQLCSLDADCPQGETCQLAPGPDCTIGTGIEEQGFFSFIKEAGCIKSPIPPDTRPDCTCTPPPNGTDCGAMRAVVAGVNPKTVAGINDGLLYTCKVNVAAGASGPYPLAISNIGISDPNGTAITPADGVSGMITVGGAAGILVCDVAPSTGDNAGQFGGGTLNIADVKAIFKAAQFPAFRPPADSARFSAMDSAAADSPPICGGGGSLNIADVKLCFKRAQFSSEPNYRRTGIKPDCTSALK